MVVGKLKLSYLPICMHSESVPVNIKNTLNQIIPKTNIVTEVSMKHTK